MKKHLLIILVLSLALVAAGEPFVQEGSIEYRIVADTGQDVIHGTNIVTWMQQQATNQPPNNLATTSEQATSGPFIIIGTPSNNQLAKEALGEQEPVGAYLGFAGEDYLISGASSSDVEQAVEAFLEGERVLGELTTPTPAVDEPVVNEPQEPNETPQPNTTTNTTEPVTNTTTNNQTLEECEQRTYCDENTVREQQTNCSTKLVEYCPHGCTDATCNQGFFERIWSAIVFWR